MTEWFDLGGNLQVDDTLAADDLLTRAADVQGLRELAFESGIDRKAARAAARGGDRLRARGSLRAEEDQPLRRVPVSVCRTAAPPEPARRFRREPMMEREMPNVGGKKKYYN